MLNIWMIRSVLKNVAEIIVNCMFVDIKLTNVI